MDLQELRNQIDQTDRELVALFERRNALTTQVGELKSKSGKPVFDPEREQEVIQKRLEWLKDKEFTSACKRLYTFIMSISRQGQRKLCHDKLDALLAQLEKNRMTALKPEPMVAYQGVEASYGEEALCEYFGENTCRVHFPNFADVAEAVRSGKADFGVLPIENSSTGAIHEVYDVLKDSGCYIVGEKKLAVSHCLLGNEGTAIESLKEVYSHPQGFLQSGQFLKQHPDWKQVPYQNTAMSAKLVRDSGRRDIAAIGSARCAEAYGLTILKRKINDLLENHTRFIIIARQILPDPADNKISLSFGLPHTSGSLYGILSFFAINGINLLKVESRPIPHRNWEYYFFVDLEGNIADESIQNAVCSVMDETIDFRYLGNYRSEDEDE